MESGQLATLFLIHAFAVAVLGAAGSVSATTRRIGICVLLLGLSGVVGAVVAGAAANAGSNFIVQTWLDLHSLNRPQMSAAVLGLGLATPWLLFVWRGRLASVLVCLGLAVTLATGIAIAGKELLSPFLPHPNTALTQGAVNQQVDAGFELQLLGVLQSIPIRIAVHPTRGEVYIAAQIGIAAQGGAVVKLHFDANGRVAREQTVAPMLNRPFGLVVTEDEIFVSRSGQYTKWNNGKAEQVDTGAVTVLKDLDGDGTIDFYHDVVSGLPGARAPDYLHQNNAIAIAQDGTLYMTSANSSDGHPGRHPWEGTILRARPPTYEPVEIFARGLRNTFGLAIGPDGELFGTDNDSQSGAIAHFGDKLIEIQEGDDFGHPYAAPGSPDVTPPMDISKFALAGVAVSHDAELSETYRRSLFVVSYGEGRILRYELDSDTTSRPRKAKAHPFAVVPAATDIAAAPDGDFYVISYENRTLYRIRRKRS
jgi:glucose/arabinose dehydrogenase